MRSAEYARAFFSQTPECLFACCKHWDGRGVRSGSLQNARRGVRSGNLAKIEEGRPHRELSKIGEGRPLREFGKNEEGRPLQEFLQTSRRAPAPGTLQNSRRGVRSERGRRGAEGDKSRGDTGRGGGRSGGSKSQTQSQTQLSSRIPSRKPSRKPTFLDFAHIRYFYGAGLFQGFNFQKRRCAQSLRTSVYDWVCDWVCDWKVGFTIGFATGSLWNSPPSRSPRVTSPSPLLSPLSERTPLLEFCCVPGAGAPPRFLQKLPRRTPLPGDMSVADS